jgi:hypothetical protein
MPNILVIVSLVIFIGTIDGIPQRSLSLIDADAKQLSLSNEKCWFHISNKVYNDTKRKCQVLTQCCSGKKYSKALSLMAVNFSVDPIPVTFAACLGSVTPDHLAKTCPSALKLTSRLTFEPDDDNDKANPVYMVMNKYSLVIKDFLKNIPLVCNENEVHAYLCLSSKKLLQSCVGKILQKQYDSRGKKTYKESVKKYKAGFNGMNQLFQRIEELTANNS